MLFVGFDVGYCSCCCCCCCCGSKFVAAVLTFNWTQSACLELLFFCEIDAIMGLGRGWHTDMSYVWFDNSDAHYNTQGTYTTHTHTHRHTWCVRERTSDVCMSVLACVCWCYAMPLPLCCMSPLLSVGANVLSAHMCLIYVRVLSTYACSTVYTTLLLLLIYSQPMPESERTRVWTWDDDTLAHTHTHRPTDRPTDRPNSAFFLIICWCYKWSLMILQKIHIEKYAWHEFMCMNIVKIRWKLVSHWRVCAVLAGR